MTRRISYKGLVILLIGISVIGTASAWLAVNDSGAVVPTTTVSAGGSEGSLAGSGQIRFTILKPEDELTISNKSSQRDMGEGFG